MKKRIILFTISFLILAALIYFSDVKNILHILSNANIFIISLTFSFWFFDSILRTFRWKILLKKIEINVGFFKLWEIFVASMFFSNLSPAKTGDPMRSVLLKRIEGESFSQSLSSLVVERMMDIVFLIIVALVTMVFIFTGLGGLGQWLYTSITLYIVLILFGIFVISSQNRAEIFFTKLFRLFSFIPKVKSYEWKVKKGSEKLHKAFKKYNSISALLPSFILTGIIWTLQGFVVFFCFKSIGLSVSLISSIAIIPLSVLIGVLTFLPGSLGSSEVVTVTFFTFLYGFSLSQVTAVTLLSRLLLFWPYIIIGAIIFSLKFK